MLLLGNSSGIRRVKAKYKGVDRIDYLYTPLLDFEIKDRELVKALDLSVFIVE